MMIEAPKPSMSALSMLNPLSKTFLLLISLPISILVAKTSFLILLGAVVLWVVLLSKLSIKLLTRTLRWYLVGLIPFLLLIELLAGSADWYVRWIPSYLRFSYIFVTGSVYIFTTNPSDLALSLMRFRPLRKFAVSFSVAIRFLIVFQRKIENIIMMQKQRGATISFRPTRIFQTFRILPSIIIPAILIVVDSAEKITQTLLVRGFTTKGRITLPPNLIPRPRDLVVVAIGVALIFTSLWGPF